MNFSQLQSFITVVQLHSFSAAAKQLHFSQSTITSHINELEKELDQQLLVRSTREFHLTKAGMSCYSFAVAVVARKNALLSEYKKDSTPKTLRLVTSSVPAHFYLPSLIAKYRKTHPDIFFKIIQSDNRTVFENMEEFQSHIAFCGTERHNKNCIYTAIKKDGLVVITPNIEPFSKLNLNEPFPDELLLSQPMVCRAPISGTRITFENYLIERKIYMKPQIIGEFPDTISIINSVSEKLGIAVISTLEANQIYFGENILSFPLTNYPNRYLYMVKEKNDKLLSFEQEFYDFVIEQRKDLPMEN